MKNVSFTDAELTVEDGDITIKDFSFSGVIDIYNSEGDTDITVSSEAKGIFSLNLNSDEGDVSVLNLNEREDIKKKTDANVQMNILKERTAFVCSENNFGKSLGNTIKKLYFIEKHSGDMSSTF